MNAARQLTVVWLITFGVGCSCGTDPMPPNEDFDGNVVIGTGDPDGGRADATSDGAIADAGDDPVDAGMRDASSLDASIADSGTADAGDRCAEPSTATVTASEAVQMASALDGQLVTIVGTATRTPYRCSMIPCTEEMPCCNTCTADLSIEGSIALVADPCFGADVRCSGTECAQVCVPALLGVNEQFFGRLFEGPPIRLELYGVSP